MVLDTAKFQLLAEEGFEANQEGPHTVYENVTWVFKDGERFPSGTRLFGGGKCRGMQHLLSGVGFYMTSVCPGLFDGAVGTPGRPLRPNLIKLIADGWRRVAVESCRSKPLACTLTAKVPEALIGSSFRTPTPLEKQAAEKAQLEAMQASLWKNGREPESAAALVGADSTATLRRSQRKIKPVKKKVEDDAKMADEETETDVESDTGSDTEVPGQSKARKQRKSYSKQGKSKSNKKGNGNGNG